MGNQSLPVNFVAAGATGAIRRILKIPQLPPSGLPIDPIHPIVTAKERSGSFDLQAVFDAGG